MTKKYIRKIKGPEKKNTNIVHNQGFISFDFASLYIHMAIKILDAINKPTKVNSKFVVILTHHPYLLLKYIDPLKG